MRISHIRLNEDGTIDPLNPFVGGNDQQLPNGLIPGRLFTDTTKPMLTIDLSTQLKQSVDNFFNENGVNVIIGVIGLVMILIAIIGIAKP